jgi:hypothetical protein
LLIEQVKEATPEDTVAVAPPGFVHVSVPAAGFAAIESVTVVALSELMTLLFVSSSETTLVKAEPVAVLEGGSIENTSFEAVPAVTLNAALVAAVRLPSVACSS